MLSRLGLRSQALRCPLYFPTCPRSRSYARPASVPRHVPNGPPPLKKDHSEPDGEFKDFRPPWFYSASHILMYTAIPAVGLYCVFIVDWGDKEHVFMPPRRWLARQKAAFFSLSPAEQQLAKSDSDIAKEQ